MGQPLKLCTGHSSYQVCFCAAVLSLWQGPFHFLFFFFYLLLLLGIKPLVIWRRKSLNSEKLFILTRKHSLLLLMILKQTKNKKKTQIKQTKEMEWGSPASLNSRDNNNHGVFNVHRFQMKNELGISKANYLRNLYYWWDYFIIAKMTSSLLNHGV